MRHESRVFFDQSETRVRANQKLGERAKTRPNFHDVIAGLDVEKRDDPSGEVLVVEKVLAETPGGCGLQLR